MKFNKLNYQLNYKYLLIALLIIVFDRITKYLATNLKAPIIFSKFFRLSYIKNYGAGFGMLQGQRILLVLISLAVVIGIIVFYKKIPKDKFTQVATALIFGGTFGNLIDRMFNGYVVDFLAFSFWPAFNIADSAISIGAIILIYYYWNK